MEIQHKEEGTHGSFYMEENGATVAEIVYSKRGEKRLVIEHTGVDQSLRGKKIGNELVHRTVEYARQHEYKITPVCQFAKVVMQRDESYHDVLG